MRHYYQKPGFTLFEMIVTISIIAVITTLFIVNYKANNNSYVERKAINEFIAAAETAVYNVLGYNDIKEMGNMYEVSGWGVSVENEKEYIVFPTVGIYLAYNKNPELAPYFVEKSLPDNIIFTKVVGCIVNSSTGLITEVGDNFTFIPSEDSGRAHYAFSYDASHFQMFNYTSNSTFFLLAGMYRIYKDDTFRRANWDCANFYLENTKTQEEYLIRMYAGGLIEQIY